MSDARGQLWSDSPYAPKITHHLYVQEKAFLAATQFISPILYGASMAFSPMPVLTLSAWFVRGLPVILFFRCMAALFNPVRRRGTVSNGESYPTPWSCSRSSPRSPGFSSTFIPSATLITANSLTLGTCYLLGHLDTTRSCPLTRPLSLMLLCS